MRFAVAALIVLLPGIAFAQGGPVQQSGSVTPGHVPMVITNGVVSDGGSALNGKIKELGITNGGTPFCINDAPITGPYHQVCMGASALGSYLVTANAYGGAASLPLRFNINGTSYDFPGNGQGNILGPNSSNMLELATFNNTTGTLLRGSDLGFRASGAMSGTLVPSPIDAQAAPYSMIAVTDDTATNTNCPGGACSGIPALAVYHKFGGTGSGGGGRIGIWSNLLQVGDLPSNPIPFQTGIFSNVASLSGANGGEFYGYAAQVLDENGGHYAITGGEIDLSLHASNTLRKEGWSITSSPLGSGPDSQHGTLYDAALGIWAAGTCGTGGGAGGSGCAGYRMGISFGRDDGYIGVSRDGTFIGVGTTNGLIQVTDGIDWHTVGFLECAIKTLGFCLDGGGDLLQKKNDPTIEWWDTLSSAIGGVQRIQGAGGNSFSWQVNQSSDGSFGASANAFTVFADAHVEFSQTARLDRGATIVATTVGSGPPGPPGLFNLYSDNADNKLKISTVSTVPFVVGSDGTVAFPAVTVSSGKHLLCIDDGTKTIYEGSTSAC